MRELTPTEEQAIRERLVESGIPEDDLLAFVVSGNAEWVINALVFQQELRADGADIRGLLNGLVDAAPGICFDCRKSEAPAAGKPCDDCRENAAAEEAPLGEANR